MKTFLKILGVSAAGFATYLYVNKKNPSSFIKDISNNTKGSLDDSRKINESRKDLQKNIQKLQGELKKSTPIFEGMQKDISDFQFKINPRLEMIQKRIDHLQK
ncbi:hypothetical protein MOO46_01300 [Apilactobacillus apisilvae]|uniref:Tropomyosin n=1 Tax=Apilactobacillus apisilvae TaxID=2923364 RepID=A0ABY4PI12_9LACO|nr:hypothetical protein [Apilactobacillus apisilvae]UQS85252.1 hypothetical protein MOO46_01300 [Apilactobacillus apisilvae]